jgi:hypothetical protein
VKNIFGAGNFPGFCEQFQPLCGFPRTRHREIPYGTFQSGRGSFQSIRVAGVQGLANIVEHFWALLQKYSRKLFQ